MQMSHSQFINYLLEINLVNLPGHYIHHLLPNRSTLAGLGISSLSLGGLLGKSNTENSEEVPICRLHINIGLNQCLITRRPPNTKLMLFN